MQNYKTTIKIGYVGILDSIDKSKDPFFNKNFLNGYQDYLHKKFGVNSQIEHLSIYSSSDNEHFFKLVHQKNFDLLLINNLVIYELIKAKKNHKSTKTNKTIIMRADEAFDSTGVLTDTDTLDNAIKKIIEAKTSDIN